VYRYLVGMLLLVSHALGVARLLLALSTRLKCAYSLILLQAAVALSTSGATAGDAAGPPAAHAAATSAGRA
jgi:hypothetical protein